MEMMDRPAIHAAEAFVKVGYPLDVEALLIVELDGAPAEVDHLIGKVEAIARDHGATVIRLSRDEAERLAFWSGRKAAFPAVGRISPDYYCMDGTIPRARLAEVLTRMRRALASSTGSRSPTSSMPATAIFTRLFCTTPTSPTRSSVPRRSAPTSSGSASRSAACLTGEHGVGVEKRDLMGTMFDESDLAHQQRLKCAFDPGRLAQPGQGVSAAASLRRAGPSACPCRPVAVPRSAALLKPVGRR